MAWGRAERLENFCVAHGLPFTRWSGGGGAQFGAERIVFTGHGEPQIFAADEEGNVVIGAERAKQLGSHDAVMAYFAAADFIVPPLRFLP